MSPFSKSLSTVVIVALTSGSALADPLFPRMLPMKATTAKEQVSDASAATPAVVTYVRSGTIVANVTITIKSSIPTTQPIHCFLHSALYGASIYEIAMVKATRSGNSATCMVSLPYSWGLSSTSAPVENSLYVITGQTEYGTLTSMARQHSSDLPTMTSVPANGTTTTFKAAVTL